MENTSRTTTTLQCHSTAKIQQLLLNINCGRTEELPDLNKLQDYYDKKNNGDYKNSKNCISPYKNYKYILNVNENHKKINLPIDNRL